MTAPNRKKSETANRAAAGRLEQVAPEIQSWALARASLLEEARAAGLLEGETREHVSFRAPPGLIEAARRRSGVKSTTELGLLALALLAQPDPVVNAMRRTRGRLGADHQLDY